MATDSVFDLVLKISQVFALGSDTAGTFRGIPGGHQPTGVLAPLNLKSDLFHRYQATMSAHYLPWGPEFRERQSAADLPGKVVRDLSVSWHHLDTASPRIRPDRMTATLALEVAAVPPQVAEKG